MYIQSIRAKFSHMDKKNPSDLLGVKCDDNLGNLV
jgi:hypothetical protein